MKAKLVIGIVLLILIGISAYIRIYVPYNHIFAGSWVNFGSPDSYGLMRYVDSAIYNFPSSTQYDPYLPEYRIYTPYPFIFSHWLLALIIRVIGLGGIPSQHTIDVISAYYPAILGILVIIPVYFLGKILFNKWAGLLAAAMVSIIPGIFLSRSMLGNTDYHVAESLFSATAMMFTILAMKSSTYYSIPAGIFLGVYLITWPGGAFFAAIMTCGIVALLIINFYRQENSFRLYAISIIIFIEALVICSVVPVDNYVPISLLAAGIFLTIAYFLSRYLVKVKRGRLFFPLALVAIVLLIAGAVKLAQPGVYDSILAGALTVFTSAYPGSSSESLPLFAISYGSRTLTAWNSFTTSFLLLPGWPIPGFALISLVLITVQVIKNRFKDPHIVLFLVWSLVVFWATLVHRRYIYYFAINVALLSGYLFYLCFLLIKKMPESSKKYYYVSKVIAVIIFIGILLAGFIPNVNLATQLASQPPFIPSKNWQSTLDWLKTNTPEPFGSDGVYYQAFHNQAELPVPSYIIVSWWDYGYWIARTAHRVPYIDPSNSLRERIEAVAKLLLSMDNDVSDSMRQLNARYIVIDKAMVTGFLEAIGVWAKADATTRSLVLRLYNGQTVTGFKSVYDNGDVKIFEYMK